MSHHINQILSCANSFIVAHVKLQDEVKDAEFHDNPLKYYQFRAGCIKGSWFNDNYLSTRNSNGLKNALVGLNSSNKSVAMASALELNLFKDIKHEKGISASKQFSKLQLVFPDILESISGDCISAKHLRSKLLTEMAKLTSLVSTLSETIEVKETTLVSKSDIGLQNTVVEQIISETLKSIPKKLAHEIRSKLARSDNKLLLLQNLLVA